MLNSCVPQSSRPTPWWNHSCETVWQRKITCWERNDIAGFNQVSLDANSVYKQAIQDCRAKICEDLQKHSSSKRWWSLTKSLIRSTSRGRPMLPPAHQLAEYFSTKLSLPNSAIPVPALKDCHQSLFTQFRFRVSHVKHILCSLDTTKSVGDDNVSPRVLKSCASALCGPLFALFRKICNAAIFPSSWKISRITPVHKKGTHSDPTNYRPIAVLPTLSRVFEQLLMTQLRCRILPFIPSEQFGFLKGSSTSDAGISLATTVASAINQRAEVRLVALDIKGAFDHVRWDGVLEHLRSIGCRGRMFRLFQSYLSDRYIRVVTSSDSSDLCRISAGVPQGAIWSPLLFNLYVRLLPSVIKHSLVLGYADYHTLLMTIPAKNDRVVAANHLNADLTALYEYGKPWNIIFAPAKTYYLPEVRNVRTPPFISK